MSEAEFCDRIVLFKEGRKIVDEELAVLHNKYPNKTFEEIFVELYKQN